MSTTPLLDQMLEWAEGKSPAVRFEVLFEYQRMMERSMRLMANFLLWVELEARHTKYPTIGRDEFLAMFLQAGKLRLEYP